MRRKCSRRAAEKNWTNVDYELYIDAHAKAKEKLSSLLPSRGMLQISTRAVNRNPGFEDPRFYGIHKAITITRPNADQKAEVSIGLPFSVQMIKERCATLYKGPNTDCPLRAFVQCVDAMETPEWALLHSQMEDEVKAGSTSLKEDTWRCAHCFTVKGCAKVPRQQTAQVPSWVKKPCIVSYYPRTLAGLQGLSRVTFMGEEGEEGGEQRAESGRSGVSKGVERVEGAGGAE